MKKLFLTIILALLMLGPLSVSAETTTVVIFPDVSTGQLAGADMGNIPSFDIKFDLAVVGDALPTNAIIQSAKIKYSQAGVSSGLLRIIDKYSADIIDSKSMGTAGQFEIASGLSYIREWFTLPSKNLGILFQGSNLGPADLIAISDLELEIEYSMPDLIPPSLDGDIVVEVGASTAKIYVKTSEIVFVNIDYGRTSNYGQKYITDNIEPSIEHLITLENLSSGSTYHYKVTMKDESGNSASTLDLTFDTLNDFIPSDSRPVDQSLNAPQQFKVDMLFTQGKAQASLSWSYSNESNIQGYIIYRADAVTKQFVEYATLSLSSNTFLDENVSLGMTYYYYVRSYSNLVISPKSEEKSVIFPSHIPDEKTEEPATLQTFLIILATVSLILFVFYLLIKFIEKVDDKKSKRLKNVLKDPKHFMNSP